MGALKFSKSQSYYFKSVAEKAEEVPEIKTAIVQGEITLSQARRIVSAVTATNHREWIEKAKTLTQDELERQVSIVNPKAYVREKIKPVAETLSELKVGVNKETEKDLSQLKEILSQKLRRPASLSDVIAWMAKECRKRFDPTQQKTISSGNKKPLRPGRHAVRITTKREVFQRENMQCTYVSSDGRRCQQKRWLHLHHELPVARGGLNTADNLRLLCQAHHQMKHVEEQVNGTPYRAGVAYSGNVGASAR
jgi:polyhydroxyalkanoate synthesis regulator phasin